MFSRLIPLVVVLSTPALAQTYDRSDIVRGLCQPDGCDEFAILGADRVATTEEGSLLRTRLKTFHASNSGRKDLGEENGYVYCSLTKPAIMADQDGRTMAFFLAPFATAESRESVRRNANYHAVYFTICHGREAGMAAVQNLPEVAQRLGYRVSLAQSKVATLTRAEDILAPTERRPVEAMREGYPLPPREVPSVGAGRDQRFAERLEELPLEELPPGPVPPRQIPQVVENPDEGLLARPRRFTRRAYDALDEVGSWVLGW
jgi:hypothetical protein